MRVAVAGAGVVGSVVALQAMSRGWESTIFDAPDGPRGCSLTAAGMLSPWAELETAGAEIVAAGMRSLDRWPELLGLLPEEVFFRREGSLLAAHPGDTPHLRRLIDLIARKSGERLATLAPSDLEALEPEVSIRGDVVFLPREGQIDSQAFIRSASRLFAARGILQNSRVSRLEAGKVTLDDGRSEQFDWVFDCRGLGAKPDLPALRGVRGEIIRVHAPEVTITRPVRLLHPRYRVYVVPRPDHIYLVGATEIESEDRREITVRSALELLSALFSIQPAFAEGRVIGTDVNVRPAFPDNRPRVGHEDGLTRINGMFRHGFLLAPALAADAIAHVEREAGAGVHPVMEQVYAAD